MKEESITCWRGPSDIQAMSFDRFVRQRMGMLSWNRVRRLIVTGKLTINGQIVRDLTARVKAGDEVVLKPHAQNDSTRLRLSVSPVFVDSQIVIVNKPAGISTVAFDELERGTLLELVQRSLSGTDHCRAPSVHVVHRIDKETSGLVVFARTRSALKRLKQLFRAHNIERRYLALAQGRLDDRTYRSRLVVDRGDGRRGSTLNSRLGQEAITHIRPLEYFDTATLVQCRLETGRTHQIRIHLAEAGHPLLGEKVYSVCRTRTTTVTRTMLHAECLGFEHPLTGAPLEFSAEVPRDMAKLIRELRGATIESKQ